VIATRAGYVPGRLLGPRVAIPYEDFGAGKAFLRHMVTLVDSNGQSFDVSDRLLDDGLGDITESTEEGFLELAHGDVDLQMDNQDGALTHFFDGVTPDSVVHVFIDRETLSRRCRWTRLFGGVLDLPWSLQFNHEDRTVEVQAFSFSKLAEKASAETIRRDVTGITASVNNGSRTVTVAGANAVNLLPGDEIELSDNTNSESQTIAEIVTPGSDIRTIGTFGATYSDVDLECRNPYLRDQSIEALASRLFAAAGISTRQIDILNTLAAYPIATPASASGLPRDRVTGVREDPRCFLFREGRYEMFMDDGGSNVRMHAPNLTGPWTKQTSPGFQALADWTPYYDTEPTLFAFREVDKDDGMSTCAHHNNDFKYQLVQVLGAFNLHRNGSNVAAGIITVDNPANAQTGIDVDPVSGTVWVSCTGLTGASGEKNVVKTWLAGSGVTTVATGFSGQVRYLRRLQVIAIHQRTPKATGTYKPLTTVMRLYNPSTGVLLKTVTVPQNLWAWSLRVFRNGGVDMIGGLYLFLQTMRLKLWDLEFNEIADYEVSTSHGRPSLKNPDAHSHLAVIASAEGETLMGSAGRSQFVLARGYAGVVPYANFDGMSCAEALKQLALLCSGYIDVDRYAQGRLVGRARAGVVSALNAVELSKPFSRESWPLWEFYRTSAEVSGADEVNELVGDTGDSQHRISLSSPLIATGSLAHAIGILYVALLSRRVTQEQVTVEEPGRLLHVFDEVILAGRRYAVIELQMAPLERQYDLRLVECA